MATPTVLGRDGPIRLGKLLGKGAEGAVYEVVGRPDAVAKIYLEQISAERAEKLVAMQSLITPVLRQLTAWPTELLKLPTGKIGGFLMPNIGRAKDIHCLYSPKSRLAEFPHADWRMLVRAALNTARAFAALHEAGCLVGDVNHGGVRVAHDATVTLIDCDSFQVSYGGRTYVCEVGVQEFTPPELQGKPFKSTVRSANHDNFGLAVFVFQLLMMGRHPFAGRYRGPSADMDIPNAIGQFRYAYARDSATTLMQPPPHTAPVLAASPELVALWEQAFSRAGAQSGGRPSAQQWVRALVPLEKQFAKCGQNPAHFYFAGYGKCPWCPIEQIGVALFGTPIGVIPPTGGVVFNIETLWVQIKAIPSPGHMPPMPVPPAPQPSSTAAAIGARRSAWKGGGIFLGLAILVLGMMLNTGLWLIWGFVAWGVGAWIASRGKEDVTPLRDLQHRAKAAYEDLAGRWRRECEASAFEATLAELNKKREEWTQLPARRQRQYADLIANRQKHALRQFLDGYEIDRAKIPKIGAAKKAMLESYGIETAADVTRNAVMQVPGFGPALTQQLLTWRQGVERKFRFDPNSAIDPRQVADLDRTIATRRSDLEKELRQGPAALQQLRQTIMSRRQTLEGPLRQAAAQLAQATADLAAVV